MSQIGTDKAPNQKLTIFGRFFDWLEWLNLCFLSLGNAKTENEDISSDALRIASLEAALRASNIKAMVWQVKAEDLQDKLTVAEAEVEDCRSLVAYARKRKASLAKHDAKRRGK